MSLHRGEVLDNHSEQESRDLSRRRFLGFLNGTLTSLAVFSAQVRGAGALPVYSPPFGVWKRVADDLILGPRPDRFESAGVFNPAVVNGAQWFFYYGAADKYVAVARATERT